MGFLERAIQNGIRQGLGDAVGKAIGNAVRPAVEQVADKAVEGMDRAAQKTQESMPSGETMSRLERSMQNYATEVAKNVKTCPACGEPARASESFCPKCGTKLPEQTMADGAVCPACGKQNHLGTKFCTDCGTKLPQAVMEEQAAQAKQDAVMREWDEKLPQYPKWSCGGSNPSIEEYDGCYTFSARFASHNAARMAVEQYRELLLGSGFRQAGQYPSADQLFKKVGGICYNADLEHCFDGDDDLPTIGFCVREPSGGFDYVKPAPKQKSSFFDLFK